MEKIKFRKITLLTLIFIILLLGAIFVYTGRSFLQGAVLGGNSTKPATIIISGEARPKIPLQNAPFDYLGIFKELSLSNGTKVALIDHAVYPGLGLALIDKRDNFIEWLTDAQLGYLGKGRLESAGEILDWWRLEDFNQDNKKELAIRFGIAGTAMVHPFYLYSYATDKNDFKLLMKLINASSRTEIKDLDNDEVYEFIHSYSLSGIGKAERDLLRFKDVWRLKDGKPIKVNHLFPQEYQELIDLHTLALTKKEWEPDVSFYYPVLRCLKEKAELTSQGKEIGIDECQEILQKRYAGSGE